MLLRKLVRTAWSYKAQFISMIIMLSIGIGVFLGFNIEWKSIEDNTETFFEQTSYADLRLYSDTGFSENDVEAIRELDGVDRATRYLYVSVGLKAMKKTVTLNVSEDYNVSTMLITDGADYNADSDRGIWLSDRFAQANGIEIGDTLTLTFKGTELSGEVVGLCKSGENMICTADSNQLMPDYDTHGFVYISPTMLENSLGAAFYPQINVISDMDKAELEEAVKSALGRTALVADKSLHTAYAGAASEAEEGKTMGAVLPVLFLAVAVLTMVTTMHRIASNEKLQIGTLKALGLRDEKILLHYTSYGLFTGILGTLLGTALGYAIAALIISPHGMMSTYFDLPEWHLTMPAFCIPVIILTVILLTLISLLSVKRMLAGTAADALRPYAPRAFKASVLERLPFADGLSFSVKWNLRDILRHKARSAMTLIGVFGCMLLIVGGLGMNDTMQCFLDRLSYTNNYVTKINVSETADNAAVSALAEELDGDWQAALGISLDGSTSTLEIYGAENGKLRFLTEDNEPLTLGDDGVYLCLRLKDTAAVGSTVEFSPYGSDTTYTARVAGYFRSLVSESIAMSDTYAESLGIEYHIGSVYTDTAEADVDASPIISGKQEKTAIMATYDTFLELLRLMVIILIVGAVILGTVVLYDLGAMSYVERRRELATLKVLGFRDRALGRLLTEQNLFLTLLGVLIGLPCGVGVLQILITALCSEYELCLTVSALTCAASLLLCLGVSFAVSLAVARKNQRLDMTEALKSNE